jgi:hypothetical protein
MRTWHWRLLILASVALPAQTVHGQAVCSAPHSSPVLARGGTIETLAPGSGWFQASVFRQSSGAFFDPTGGRRPYLANGRADTYSLYFTGSVGVVRGLDVWAQLPVHRLSFSDITGERARSGIGDPRVSIRLSPQIFGANAVPLALRAGVKLPGTDFPVDPRVLPLGEGQRDWEVSVEAGQGFGGLDVTGYALGWIGYRWRERNDETDRKPGDELFAHAAFGVRWRAWHVELAAEIMSGQPSERFGLELETGRRQLLQIQPTLGYDLGRGTFEITAAVPLAGKNLPTGPGVSLGYRFTWGAY